MRWPRPSQSRPPPPNPPVTGPVGRGGVGPASRMAIGRRQGRRAEASTGQCKPYVRGGTEEKSAGKKKMRRERELREEERRVDSRKPAVSKRGWGRGAAGESSAGLTIEGANDVQRSKASLKEPA